MARNRAEMFILHQTARDKDPQDPVKLDDLEAALGELSHPKEPANAGASIEMVSIGAPDTATPHDAPEGEGDSTPLEVMIFVADNQTMRKWFALLLTVHDMLRNVFAPSQLPTALKKIHELPKETRLERLKRSAQFARRKTIERALEAILGEPRREMGITYYSEGYERRGALNNDIRGALRKHVTFINASYYAIADAIDEATEHAPLDILAMQKNSLRS